MANVSRIRGFVPSKSLIGAPWSSLVRQYPCVTPTGGVFIGDAVTLDTDGTVIPAVSGGVVLGVVVAIGETTVTFGGTGYFNPNDLGQRFLGATETGVVGVVPAEAATFNVFAATAAGALDLALGDTADILPGAGGSTITGNSSYSITTSSNADVKVVEQNTAPDNDSAIVDAQYIVKFVSTEHTF